MAVVLAGALVLLLLLLGAWLLIGHAGSHMLPNRRPDPQPHSYLRMTGSGANESGANVA